MARLNTAWCSHIDSFLFDHKHSSLFPFLDFFFSDDFGVLSLPLQFDLLIWLLRVNDHSSDVCVLAVSPQLHDEVTYTHSFVVNFLDNGSLCSHMDSFRHYSDFVLKELEGKSLFNVQSWLIWMFALTHTGPLQKSRKDQMLQCICDRGWKDTEKISQRPRHRHFQ